MAKRKIIKAKNLGSHRNPIPIGVVLGNLILPSVIGGQGANGISDDPEVQIRQAFENMKKVMEAAGGTTDNIGKITVYLKDFRHREIVNKEWVKMFGDEENRPARHVMKADVQGKTVIQLDVIGWL